MCVQYTSSREERPAPHNGGVKRIHCVKPNADWPDTMGREYLVVSGIIQPGLNGYHGNLI